MKKIFAALAAGLLMASAIPAMAADTDNNRLGYCWQVAGDQSDDGYCRDGYCRRSNGDC